MRERLRCFWVLLVFTWLTPSYGAELTPPPQTKPDTTPVTNNSSDTRLIQPDTELIDVPTASILDYGSFSSRTRMFTNGGVDEWIAFGVLQRLNIGASLNVDKFVGTASPVQITNPDLQLKFRLYDGTSILPALAVGFDNQGYLYNRVDHLYNQKDRGLYIVGSQEVIVPGLQINGGMNIPDFNDNPLYGFMGADYNIQDKVLIMAEWDNINDFANSRINMGLRVYVTTNLTLDFAVRSITQGGTYDNGISPGNERTIAIKYVGNF